MRISFSPMRRDDAITLEKTGGDCLLINGSLFDFGSLNNGDILPGGVIPCEWIVGPVERVDGEVCVTVLLPHGPNPSDAVAFPSAVLVVDDGPIDVPRDLVPDIQIDDAEKEVDNVEP